MTLMWIALALLAWVVVPFPLAVLVGRMFARGSEPLAPIVEPATGSHAMPRVDLDARQVV